MAKAGLKRTAGRAFIKYKERADLEQMWSKWLKRVIKLFEYIFVRVLRLQGGLLATARKTRPLLLHAHLKR